MFSNNLLAGVSGQGGGYTIDDSLRLNDNDSAYLTRTPTVLGSRTRFSFSAWVKRCKIGSDQALFCVTSNETNSPEAYEFRLEFSSSDVINIISYLGSYAIALASQAVYRDTSGWYHIVLAVNTYDRTSTNRVKLYVNGELQQLTGTYPASGHNTFVNTLAPHKIGKLADYSPKYFDGYIAEVIFDDNVFLTADNLGKIDSITGEWSPKQYSPPYSDTFGTNGFYLAFEDGSALGDDTSGNANDWTPTNLASTDQMLDTPTNNFATLTPTNSDASTATLSEGNLKLVTAVSGYGPSLANIGASSGKWYWEVLAQSASSEYLAIGIAQDTWSVTTGTNALGFGTGFSLAYYSNGQLSINSSTTAGWGATFTTGDIIGVALDMDAGTIEFYKNNVSQGVAYSSLSGTVLGGVSDGGNSLTTLSTSNFGQDSSFAGNKTRQGNTDANGIGDFYYTPPTGYLALCTDNLPEPTIVDSESHFNVVTYTGTGTTLNVTGVGFQPDLVWMKRRDSANTHDLIDVVRGDTARLFPNLTDAELSDVTFSFDSDGFSPDPTKANENAAGGSYVAWCWKAGGTAVTNNDGSITSQVSANVDAGFSIVSWTGTGGGADTIGHGLDDAPEFIITKTRTASAAYNWNSYHVGVDSSAPEDYFISLNTTNARAYYTTADCWNRTKPTNSVFSVNHVATAGPSGDAMIAYCFHSVEGFSKFGSYVGNGSTDGTFVYTGFKPAFVLIKCTVTNANGHWIMKDNLRAADYNPASGNLYANLNYAEDTTASLNVDLLANGFKIKGNYAGTNASGANFIYMAFAEHPFNYATGR